MRTQRIAIVTMILLIISVSCNKQLDLKPSDVIAADQALTSMDDLQRALWGVYAANAGASNAVYIASILSDESRISYTNRGQGQVTFKWEYTSEESEYNADFASYYSMIDGINRILTQIDDIPTAGDNDVLNKKRIKGEVTALRGIAHFNLLIRFMPPGYDAGAMGVPIQLFPDLYAQPARASVGAVMDQVRADLQTGRGEVNIPATPDNIARLSQAAIAAYQARAALLTKSWPDVITYAQQAIQLSGARLATGIDFLYYWYDVNEIESLWKYRSATPQSYWFDTNGDVFFEPSEKLKNEYDRYNDIRFRAYFEMGPSFSDTTRIIKYPGSAAGAQVNDIKLVRAAELYLDLAEAYARENNLDNAALYLNDLRLARINGYSPVTFADQQDAIRQVMNERFKELCYEGFRFFDLKRTGLPIERDTSDVQNLLWREMPADDHRFALPIPQHEIFANKNMVQNPGY